MYPILVWKEGFIRLLNRNLYGQILHNTLRLRASLNDPFLKKNEGFTKRPPSFYIPRQMNPYFSFVLTERPLFFLYLVCHR